MPPNTPAFDFNEHEFIGSRPATEAERRFLRRYNLIRLISLFTTFFGMGFFVALVLLANGLLLFMLYDFRNGPIAQQIGFGIFILAVLVFLDFVVIKAWGKPWLALMRARLTLPVPDVLEVTRWKSALFAVGHETSELLNIWRQGDLPLLVPEHWEPAIANRLNNHERNPDDEVIEIVSLPGASNQVIRFLMRQRYSARRVDSVFQDFGHVVVGFDKLSVDKEIRARQPVIRSNTMFGFLLMVPLFVGLGLAIASAVISDGLESESRKLEWQSASELVLSGKSVDIDQLSSRGFTAIKTIPALKGKLITAAPEEMLEVRWMQGREAFIVLVHEKRLLDRVASYYPWSTYERSGDHEPDLARFREELLAATQVTGITEMQRSGIQQRIRSLPDSVLEAQMLHQKMAGTPATNFLQAIEPMPKIMRAPDRTLTFVDPSMRCTKLGALCVSVRDREGVTSIPVLTAADSSLLLWPAALLDDLAAFESHAAKAEQTQTLIAWLSLAWKICVGLAVLILAMHLLARRRITRFYAESEPRRLSTR